MLTGFVNTKFIGHPRIVAWPDADLAGDPNTSRSTSGHYIELCTGDQHHFPLSWGCRRQTSTSCHTCEAETVSLATCLRQQALPAQQLLDRLLGQSIDLFSSSRRTTRRPSAPFSADTRLRCATSSALRGSTSGSSTRRPRAPTSSSRKPTPQSTRATSSRSRSTSPPSATRSTASTSSTTAGEARCTRQL